MSDSRIVNKSASAEPQSEPSQSPPDLLALPVGARVGVYVIEAVLGSGGFGITYRVRHETLNKQFALKEYFPRQFSYRDKTSVEPTATSEKEYAWGLDRFVKEARALAKFKHPAILDVSDIFAANNTAYMVLAYEEAPNLGDWLNALDRPASQEELDRLAAPLLNALELVHGHGMLHRDIAPDNILVRPDGTPVLIDFGAARDDLQHRLAPVTAVIKPGYSPPEQYEASALRQGPWSDIYGFGATLYCAIAGALPVDSEERFDSRVRTEAALRARGSYRKGFLDAIDWAMELQPEKRPQSAAEWRTKLLFDEAAQANKAKEPPRRTGIHLPRLSATLLISVAAAVIGAIALGALLWPCQLLGIGCRPLGPLQLEITLPKRTYLIGDNLTFDLRPNRDCYFMVYTLGPTGEVERHDPTQNAIFMGSDLLKGGQWRHLPVNGYATIKAPSGTFELGAICSKEPLANIGLSDAQLREPTRGGRRSFSFALDAATNAVPRAEIARATITYDVKP